MLSSFPKWCCLIHRFFRRPALYTCMSSILRRLLKTGISVIRQSSLGIMSRISRKFFVMPRTNWLMRTTRSIELFWNPFRGRWDHVCQGFLRATWPRLRVSACLKSLNNWRCSLWPTYLRDEEGRLSFPVLILFIPILRCCRSFNWFILKYSFLLFSLI